MAIRLVRDIFNTPSMAVPIVTTAMTTGSAVVRDDEKVILATASAFDADKAFGVITGPTVTNTATSVEVTPFIFSPAQLWSVDCTNTTDADQRFKAHLMTDELTLNNTDTTSTDKDARFVAISVESDTKLIGYFIGTPAV